MFAIFFSFLTIFLFEAKLAFSILFILPSFKCTHFYFFKVKVVLISLRISSFCLFIYFLLFPIFKRYFKWLQKQFKLHWPYQTLYFAIKQTCLSMCFSFDEIFYQLEENPFYQCNLTLPLISLVQEVYLMQLVLLCILSFFQRYFQLCGY